jgi:hypothetical protein
MRHFLETEIRLTSIFLSHPFMLLHRRNIWLPCAVLAFAIGGVRADDAIEFNRDIRPILSDKCFFCHGPDSATREAGLRLDREAEAKADNDGVTAIVPGDADASELIYRIFTDDADDLMPPEDSERHLTAKQKDLLKRWIEQGAKWQQHWAFVSPATDEPPAKTANDPWIQSNQGNAIDAFVLARLREKNLSPSPLASRESLIRRVTLDLSGLPPTLEEIDTFLADPSPDFEAYEKVVDRLLKSPRYGEAMALPWLDAARFADSDGYQNDGPREMWRWRDWVIDAYNRDLPFDQFTIEQLAGDLLPNATLDQKIATGFNRNHRYNSEAGLVLEEFLLENAVDRVDTTSTVWMGLTVGCARCHDHKFDPVSTREYYQLIAFFDNITESGRAIKFGNSEPYITAATKLQQPRLEKLEADLERAEHEVKAEPQASALTARVTIDEAVLEDLIAEQRDLRAGFEDGKNVREGVYGKAMQFPTAEDFIELETKHRFLTEQRWAVSMWIRPGENQGGVILSKQQKNTRRPGLAIELHKGKLRVFSITRWIAGVNGVESSATIPVGSWTHITVMNDGSQRAGGLTIHLNGGPEPAAVKILHNTNSNKGGASEAGPLTVGAGVNGTGYRGSIDELRLYQRSLWPDELRALAQMPEKLAGNPIASADKAIRSKFAAQYKARMAWQKYWDSLPTTMVMQEMETPRETHIRERGIYDAYGEKVEPDVPEVFPGLPEGAQRNRLGFARWLVSGEHPLTARVAVNRYWLRYFGTGLVKSAEDFGQQGELPSHPGLLDWLATEFVRSGWDVKAMQRLIVTSATYRQSSHVTPEILELDPGNRWLARGPRQRLPAHVIRDQALAHSGLLVEKLGGPSVKPLQPDGLWKEMSNEVYKPGKGDDLYRRSLYTHWKRTVLPPSLAMMDAADREVCAISARRTNTPLQALTLLNESNFVESARLLAARMMEQDDPVRFGFRLVTAREPSEKESATLQAAFAAYRKEFSEHPDKATELLGKKVADTETSPTDLAAAMTLANVLLNLDEAITK